jgi:hypothetical protein
MRLTNLIFLFIVITIGCDKKNQQKKLNSFDNFVFTNSELYSDYSIKFTNSDTIFLERRFPKPKELSYSIIQREEIEKLDSFLKKNDFKRYDTLYFQNNLQDGASYKFYLTKDTVISWVLIYGNEAPRPLYDFAKWLDNLKNQQTFYQIDTTIDFGNLKYILLPPIPPPPINNSH